MGLLEIECRQLIRRFITFYTLHRPFITLKWAESAEHFIDIERTDDKPVVLSSPLSSMLVHKKRAEADAIMVGRRTALLDNPSQTVRNWYGRNPIRIVLDRALSLPHSLHLFDGEVSTIVFTAEKHSDEKNDTYKTIDFTQDVLPQIMEVLYQQKIQSLLVEGGSQLLQSFIDTELWVEVYIEKCPCKLNSGVKAPEISDKISYSEEKHFATTFRHYLKRNLCLTNHIKKYLVIITSLFNYILILVSFDIIITFAISMNLKS